MRVCLPNGTWNGTLPQCDCSKQFFLNVRVCLVHVGVGVGVVWVWGERVGYIGKELTIAR